MSCFLSFESSHLKDPQVFLAYRFNIYTDLHAYLLEFLIYHGVLDADEIIAAMNTISYVLFVFLYLFWLFLKFGF